MKITRPLLTGLLLLTGLSPVLLTSSEPTPPPAHTATAEMAHAAADFIASLDEPQRTQALRPFQHPDRTHWQYIPTERDGIPLSALRPDQDYLGIALLHTALSHSGFRKATTIMSLERVLHELENQSPRRDSEKYYLTIYGTPAPTGTWGWRFEGHHLSCNLTIIDGRTVSLTPSFLGANPGTVLHGTRQGLSPLAAEEDAGRALAITLTDAQKTLAQLPLPVPPEVLSGSTTRATPLTPQGIPSSQLTPIQQTLLAKIIETYTSHFRPELTATPHLPDFTFSYCGSAQKGQPHYYRVQSSKILLEYDNTQNNANHPHAVWRDFAGDFGRDHLAAHLHSESSPPQKSK